MPALTRHKCLVHRHRLPELQARQPARSLVVLLSPPPGTPPPVPPPAGPAGVAGAAADGKDETVKSLRRMGIRAPKPYDPKRELNFDAWLARVVFHMSVSKIPYKQGRNQLGGRGGRPLPPVKSWAPPSKMWLFIVIARRKCDKRVLSLAQYYTILTKYTIYTTKVSWVIINTISIYIKLKLQKLLYN